MANDRIAADVADGKHVTKNKVLEGTVVKQAGVAAYCAKLKGLGDTTTCK